VTLKDTADASYGLALGAGLAMFAGGFISLMLFMDFLSDGEMSAELAVAPCIVISAISLVLFIAFNISVIRVLINTAPPSGRRAAYFQLLFPILLISFMVATPKASFAPSYTFAFPLLLLGAFAYPYSALQMRKAVLVAMHENLVVLKCFRCTYVLQMHVDELWLRCPYCGQINMNPGKPEGGKDGMDKVEAPSIPDPPPSQ